MCRGHGSIHAHTCLSTRPSDAVYLVVCERPRRGFVVATAASFRATLSHASRGVAGGGGSGGAASRPSPLANPDGASPRVSPRASPRAPQVTREFNYMQKREARMKQTSESTASRIRFFAYVSILVLLLLSFWQTVYLKSFFRSKKLL